MAPIGNEHAQKSRRSLPSYGDGQLPSAAKATAMRHRGRYRVACQAMDLISVDLFEGAGVLAAVKDKALARGPAALLDLRCARRPAQCQIGTAE